MSVTSFVRWKGGSQDDMTQAGKKAKVFFEKYGAEMFRISRFHTGPYIGEWLVVMRYANWSAYGKCQDALAKDAEYQKLVAHVMTKAQITGRSLLVGLDI